MEEGGECTLWRTHRYVISFVFTKLSILLPFNNNMKSKCLIFRLDGQVDVVDSPKPIKTKEVNTNKMDKNITTESPVNKNLGRYSFLL